MMVRLGNTQIGLFRYLGLWGGVVLVFAVQGFMQDVMNGSTVWSIFSAALWTVA